MRQERRIKLLADELKIKYADIAYLLDCAQDPELKDKHYIVHIPFDTPEAINWDKLKTYAEMLDITLALEDMRAAPSAQAMGLRYYSAYPITTYYDLTALASLNVSQLLLGAPLYFDLENVSKFGIPIRLVANLAYDAYIPRKNGITGTYLRPEDIPTYEKYVSSVEFASDRLSLEKTLFEVYRENEWNGNL